MHAKHGAGKLIAIEGKIEERALSHLGRLVSEFESLAAPNAAGLDMAAHMSRARALAVNLQSLDLRDNAIGVKGMAALANIVEAGALASCRVLDLHGNPASEAKVGAAMAERDHHDAIAEQAASADDDEASAETAASASPAVVEPAPASVPAAAVVVDVAAGSETAGVLPTANGLPPPASASSVAEAPSPLDC